MRKSLLILFCLIFVGLQSPAWAASSPLNISVDHGVPLTLSGPASSVFIANPEIADVQVMSPTSIMVFGKRTGETTFMATDGAGNTLAQRTIIVSQDLSDLRTELDAAIPGNKIEIKPLPNGIVLTGEARDASSVADAFKMAQRFIAANGDIINRIRVVGSNQIQIRVRFAEVERDIDNTLGIDWNSAATFGGFVFGIASGNAIANNAAGQLIRPNNNSLAAPNDVISLAHTGHRTSINNLIDALAQDGLVSILAEPTLTAMSGETANFLAGGEFPIAIPQGGSSSAITVQFKSFGVSLAFTPTLISENRINLHVKPEVSELTNNGSITTDSITIPGLKVRRAETTVELASGESFAIAGLMDNNQAQTVNKYPLIGDLPILGALFRSDHFQSGQTELVVIITPYIVKPSNEQLAMPTDGFTTPTESDRLIDGRYSNSDPNARPLSGEPTAVNAERPAPPPPAPVVPPLSETVPKAAPASAVSSAPIGGAPVSTTSVVKPASAITASAPSISVPTAPLVISPKVTTPSPLRTAPTDGTASHAVPAGPGGFLLE